MHLDRLVTVLEAVAIAGRPLSAAELRDMTELPLPTCYRLLQMLKEQRLLEDPKSNSRYIIGERLIRIAHLARTDADVCGIAAPILKNATRDFGDAVFLSRFKKTGVSIIHVETPSDPTISYIHPGLGYRPMHACSCSKVIAAYADDQFRDLILNGPMKPYTDKTRTTKTELESEFKSIRKKGFAECVEEIEIGISSVAAPVTIDNVGAVFSVGAIGPIRRFNKIHRGALGKQMIDLAADVSASIQSRPQAL
jgi:DNA-binding IclR family transcriptional regulator